MNRGAVIAVVAAVTGFTAGWGVRDATHDTAGTATEQARPEDMTLRACLSYNRSLERAGVPERDFLDCSRSPRR